MQPDGCPEKRACGRTPIISSCRFFCVRKYKYGLAQIQNMSMKGMGLVTEEELWTDFPLEMWMPMPSGDEYFHLFGDVVWTKKIESGKYIVGLTLKKDIPKELAQILH